jgi:excisionase family DNA binding protein
MNTKQSLPDARQRIRAAEVAKILGVGTRCVQKMAARGELPSAAQIGKLWTFDKARIEQFLADAESEVRSRAETASASAARQREPHTAKTISEAGRAYQLALERLRTGFAPPSERLRAKGVNS